MSNNSNQFIAFEINGADDVEISGNTIAGSMNGVLKSNSKIEKLKISDNTILNTNEVEVLQKLICTIEPATGIPKAIKDEILDAIRSLETVKTEQEKVHIFRKIADISEKLIHLGSSVVTVTPAISTLISQLPL